MIKNKTGRRLSLGNYNGKSLMSPLMNKDATFLSCPMNANSSNDLKIVLRTPKRVEMTPSSQTYTKSKAFTEANPSSNESQKLPLKMD